MSLIMSQMNAFIENTYVKNIVEYETEFMQELFEKHKNSCEDFVEEFIQRVFNSNNMRFDIGENDDLRNICGKSSYVFPILNYIGKYQEDNYGERTYQHLDSFAKTLNLYALIWAYENIQVFENIYKEKELS